MMKKIFAILLMAFMLLGTFGAFAEVSYLDDGANLLSDSGKASIANQLAAVSEKTGLDVVIVTTQSLGGKTPMAYADDYYDYNGYSDDGVLLLVAMESRDWWISTKGYGITAFTDAGIRYIGDQFVEKLSDGEYEKGMSQFVSLCDDFIAQAKTGKPYDNGNLPKAPFNVVMSLGISVVVGLIVGLIGKGMLKSQLKSVSKKETAADYVDKGSLKLRRSHEFFLYRTVQATPKPQSNSSSGSSTHTSSSGSTHGGGGGKF